MPGFYAEAGGRPELRLPPRTEADVLRAKGGWFFYPGRPTPREEWRAIAEQRWILAMQTELHLPLDSPPELILLSAREKDGRTLRAAAEYRQACH